MLTTFALFVFACFTLMFGSILTVGIGFFFIAPYFLLLFAVAYLMMAGQTTADQLQPRTEM